MPELGAGTPSNISRALRFPGKSASGLSSGRGEFASSSLPMPDLGLWLLYVPKSFLTPGILRHNVHTCK